MSRDQLSVAELMLSLDDAELQEAERVRAAVYQQLTLDRGGAVLCSLVDYYLDSSSSQAALLLSSIREPHHKVLLEKLNEALTRPGSRLAGITLLGHLVRKQPPWIHYISQAPLLPALLRCLKTDGDVVVLVSGVLVLIALLPMIPQAGKQHIYDFFDVFGRLVSWSYRNPGQVLAAYLVHLRAAAYSLFHRLYGMFPCSFLSYLRLHYGMTENRDAFREQVKPMLDQVRIHPELVTGTQDYELDPARWRRYEVHDIIIECSRLSLDPLESSCEEDVCPAPALPRLHPDLSPAPHDPQPINSSGGGGASRPSALALSVQVDDVTWSPSSHCGLSTPPPEPAATGPAPSLSRSTSLSGGKPASVPGATPTTGSHQGRLEDGQQPIRAQDEPGLSDVVDGNLSLPTSDVTSAGGILLLTATPRPDDSAPAPPYEPLFELALPRAASLFIGKKTQEALERAAGKERGAERGAEPAAVSPLEVLDRMIQHGADAHQRLSRRSSAGARSAERSSPGGPAQGEELQALRSQLLLVHGQLQYERFKRQQHAIRNRRLLRRVINAAALEEQTVAMNAQLAVQDQEIRSLRSSLAEERRRRAEQNQNLQNQTDLLLDQLQLLQRHQQDGRRHGQQLQSELEEARGRLRELEAELQRANRKAEHAEHQLTQLKLKLSSSEQLQQQTALLHQQLLLLRETNRALAEQLEGGHAHRRTEEAMLRRSVGRDVQRLKDGEVLQRQRLEAANHRTAELEGQLTRRDALVQELKALLENAKAHSRAELWASESRCIALRRVSQALQTEMLHLYSQIHLEPRPGSDTPTQGSAPDAGDRPITEGSSSSEPRPSPSSAVVINGAVDALCSSPIDSPLAVGSFLEQQARRLFGAANQSQEEEEAQPESPPLGQEVEEATLMEPPAADSAPSVRQRRDELTIMDYDESLPDA